MTPAPPPNAPWRNIGHVAADVVREALARRSILAMLSVLGLGQIGLLLALDIDVVEGAVVSSRLLGELIQLGDQGSAAGEALRPVYRFLGHAVFHLGMIFGVVSTSDLAVRALSPGRVELLLSLPVRRSDLVLGTWCGVMAVSLIGALFAVGGFAAVLGFKVGSASLAPLFGAAAASLGFGAVYAAMLLATTLVRSAALAGGAGMLLYVVATATSSRQEVLLAFERGWGRDVAAVLMAPLPRLLGVAKAGAALAAGEALDGGELAIAVGTTLCFGAACVLLAVYVVQRRDW